MRLASTLVLLSYLMVHQANQAGHRPERGAQAGMAAAAARPSVRPPRSGTLPMMTPFTSEAKLPFAPLVTLLEMGTRSPATNIPLGALW